MDAHLRPTRAREQSRESEMKWCKHHSVRPLFVVLPSPVLDPRVCVSEAHEPVLVQALVAQSAVERLDVRVLVIGGCFSSYRGRLRAWSVIAHEPRIGLQNDRAVFTGL